MENLILVVTFSKMEAFMKVTIMMLATIFTSIHITYTFTFFICSNSFVVFGHWSFCINVKLLQMIFTPMTLTKLVGISSTLSKLFLFWRWYACLNSSHMLTQCEISFNNNQRCMMLKVAFFGCHCLYNSKFFYNTSLGEDFSRTLSNKKVFRKIFEELYVWKFRIFLKKKPLKNMFKTF
jgi:hypothetical protein